MEQGRASSVLFHKYKLERQAIAYLSNNCGIDREYHTTDAGLKVRAELDENKYATKVKVSKNELEAINLSRHAFHGDWNYTISPNRKTK